jgi:hypothetical protein
LLVCLALGAADASGQATTLRGFITDRSSSATLEGANVILLDAQQRLRGVVSNADGYYQLAAIPPGVYALRISYVGYEPYTDTLQLGASPLVTLSVALEPGELLDEVIVQQEGGAAALQGGQQQVRPADLV